MSLTSLTIEYLNKCNLRCAHCSVNASPDGTKKIEPQEAKEWIAVAKGHGAKDIYICGGEPFLVFDELRELARHSRTLGIRFTTFSNAFWASSLETAKQCVSSLKEDGLTSLHLSLDCFHLREGIPIRNFLNVAEAADDIGLDLTINVIQTKGKETAFDSVKKAFLGYGAHFQYGPIRPLGRASVLGKENFKRGKKDSYNLGCRSYANLLISPNGEVFSCCGSYHHAGSNNPLRLGNARDFALATLIEKFRDLKLLHMIATFGPHFIEELISPDKKIYARKDFSYICDFCNYLLNSEDNVNILQMKLENPDSDLMFRLKLAEISRKNIDRLRTHGFNSRLYRIGKVAISAFRSFIGREKVVLTQPYVNKT